jgi:threonine dehydrogenase-like Zn-dependent dehydrogenase
VRAVRNTTAGVEVLDVPSPDGAGVRVRVRAAGICGTDLSMIKTGPLPVTLGHEIAGELDDGTPVAIDPTHPCGTCDQCVQGRGHLCRTGVQRALGIGVDGGMADEVLVAPSSVVPLPRDLAVQDACLVEPLAVAVHGLRIAGVDGGARVAVVGAGSVGLLAAAAATSSGGEVGLVARHDRQLAAGEALGTTAAEGEYDVVVDAAGSESALRRVTKLCRPGATVVVMSTHWGLVPVPGIASLMKELRFQWSFTYGTHAGGRDVDSAAMLLARRPEIVGAVVTHRLPLSDAAEAFRVASDRAAGAIKVVLEPS